MSSYLQQYGIEEEHRNRIIKRIIFAGIGVVVVAIAAYFFFHNYPEKRIVRSFLGHVNSRDYQEAYREWGCTAEHPCPNYDYQRFLQDWGSSKKATSPWKIASVDGCKSFVTVNVQAPGAELESLSVQRADYSLGFAPAPECQERKWRFRQFLQRIFGGGSKPAPAATGE